MALVRITALKDFRTAALSTTDVTTGFNIGVPVSGQSLYAGMHLTSASLGTTSRVLAMSIQSASSSGFGAAVTRVNFSLSTMSGAEWATPVSSLSTDHPWWRASWALSTVASTGGTWKGLVWVGFR